MMSDKETVFDYRNSTQNNQPTTTVKKTNQNRTYSSAVSSYQFPTKEQAIIFSSVDGIPLQEYIFALGSKIGSQISYYWVESHAGAVFPANAFKGGYDTNGDPIYVGKAFHEGDWLPAKVIPNKNSAYVSHRHGEHPKSEYQVLCGKCFDWVHDSDGNVPSRAFEVGRTRFGETLYVGRVRHNGSLTVGKVHRSNKCCYIPYGWKELSFREYEVLVSSH